jgi:hypothetical protein
MVYSRLSGLALLQSDGRLWLPPIAPFVGYRVPVNLHQKKARARTQFPLKYRTA